MKILLDMVLKLSLAAVTVLLGGQALKGVMSNEYSSCTPPCVPGSENIMSPKKHGTSDTPVQKNLRWNVDWNTADRICNYNRT